MRDVFIQVVLEDAENIVDKKLGRMERRQYNLHNLPSRRAAARTYLLTMRCSNGAIGVE
jgi:hypothetical protein